MKGENLIPIAGELESVAQDGIVAAAESIYDYNFELNQEEINKQHYDALVSLGWTPPIPEPADTDEDGWGSDPNYDNVSTFVINESVSDPASMITGGYMTGGTTINDLRHVIKRIRTKSHRYTIDNENSGVFTITQLDDNGVSTVDNKNVIVKLPTFWYKCNTSGTTHTFSITMIKPSDESNWIKYNGKYLIGAFCATATDTGNNNNGVLTSKPGTTATTNIKYKSFINKASNTSNYAILTNYDIARVMTILYYGYYGSTNYNVVGSNAEVSYRYNNGATLSLGMTDTNSTTISSYHRDNFWGLESWLSYPGEMLYDFCGKNAGISLSSDPGNDYYGMYVIEYDGTTRRIDASNQYNGFVKQLVWNNYCDIMVKAVGAANTKQNYYCATQSYSNNMTTQQYVARHDLCTMQTLNSSQVDANNKARLLFKPNKVIINN